MAALTKYGIYTFPVTSYGAENYWIPSLLFIYLLDFMFLLLPILAVVGYFRNWKSTYLFMGLYPIVAFIFGVIPIPFGTLFYTNNISTNTLLNGVINIITVVMVVWLYINQERVLTMRRSGP